MRRGLLVSLGVAGLAAVGLATSRTLGSRPEEPRYVGPLPRCPPSVNCYGSRTTLHTDVETAREAAIATVRAHNDWLTGRALRVTTTELGATAVFKAGLFRDDVAVAVTAEGEGRSVLHVRSASRVGESDLGLNRLRARRLAAETKERLAE